MKVSDFGLATVITEGTLDGSDRGRQKGSPQRTTEQGTEMYMSPEQVKKASFIFTFRVSRRRREMYSGHGRLCVCLCVCRSPHSRTTAQTRM